MSEFIVPPRISHVYQIKEPKVQLESEGFKKTIDGVEYEVCYDSFGGGVGWSIEPVNGDGVGAAGHALTWREARDRVFAILSGG